MREWIVTNGLGGYVSLPHNRPQPGNFMLLVASLHPPIERWMFVQNILDSIVIDNSHFIYMI